MSVILNLSGSASLNTVHVKPIDKKDNNIIFLLHFSHMSYVFTFDGLRVAALLDFDNSIYLLRSCQTLYAFLFVTVLTVAILANGGVFSMLHISQLRLA